MIKNFVVAFLKSQYLIHQATIFYHILHSQPSSRTSIPVTVPYSSGHHILLYRALEHVFSNMLAKVTVPYSSGHHILRENMKEKLVDVVKDVTVPYSSGYHFLQNI